MILQIVNNTGTPKVYASGTINLAAFGTTTVSNLNIYDLLNDELFRDDVVLNYTNIGDGTNQYSVSSAFNFIENYLSALKLKNHILYGNLPHLLGVNPWYISEIYTTTQTNTVLKTPSANHRLIVQDVTLVATGTTDATITVFMGTNTNAKHILRVNVDAATNAPFFVNRLFLFQNSAAVESLQITTSAGQNFSIMASGYEVPV